MKMLYEGRQTEKKITQFYLTMSVLDVFGFYSDKGSCL